MQVVELALPEDIERLRHSKKRDLGLSEKLELRDDAVIGPSTIEVAWRYARCPAAGAALVWTP